MKNLYLVGLLGFCLATTNASIAQEAVPVKQQITDKPFIFSNLPEKISCNKSDLEKIASLDVNTSFTIRLSSSYSLKGIVVDKIQRNASVLSLNFKLSNFPSALFNIAYTINNGVIENIKGRVVNPESGDVLLLTEENQQYFLQKQLQRLFMTE